MKPKRSIGMWTAAALVVGNMMRTVTKATDLLRTADLPATVHDDPAAAVAGACAVYTDVSVSMGDDSERSRRLRDLGRYQVGPEVMALAADDAIVMHCLPAHRGEEVSSSVIDGPHSALRAQAANRLPTEQAVLYALSSGDWEV